MASANKLVASANKRVLHCYNNILSNEGGKREQANKRSDTRGATKSQLRNIPATVNKNKKYKPNNDFKKNYTFASQSGKIWPIATTKKNAKTVLT